VLYVRRAAERIAEKTVRVFPENKETSSTEKRGSEATVTKLIIGYPKVFSARARPYSVSNRGRARKNFSFDSWAYYTHKERSRTTYGRPIGENTVDGTFAKSLISLDKAILIRDQIRVTVHNEFEK